MGGHGRKEGNLVDWKNKEFGLRAVGCESLWSSTGASQLYLGQDVWLCVVVWTTCR